MVKLAYNIEIIADYQHGEYQIQILRDNHGKWFVKSNGIQTQSRLTAVEIVRYLANAAHME